MQSEKEFETGKSFLIIDGDVSFLRQMQNQLPGELGNDCVLYHVSDGTGANDALRERKFDVIMANVETMCSAGQQIENAMEKICRLAGQALIVATSSCGSVSLAVDTMGAGAHDFLSKPVNIRKFCSRVMELSQRHGRADYRARKPGTGGPGALGNQISGQNHENCTDNIHDHDNFGNFEGFVGNSVQMKAIYRQIEQMATSMAPVFITGESGTGKEVCAQALHQRSPRASGPFIAVNCSAIPRELMESEIFGVVRGAYTGADKDRAGAAELAEGGVLFLDEIGELSLELQAKLLRFLQTGTISRVGEAESRAVDVRVICATNKNPMHLIAQKKFREDLFYRLHVLPIHLPPLRQRNADIISLATKFLEKYSAEENKKFTGFSSQARELITRREWPGNVRQLQNLIRRIVVLFDAQEVDSRMLAAADVEFNSEQEYSPAIHDAIHMQGTERQPMKIEPMWRQEQRIIETAIAHHNGNISMAAAALEISPSTIYRKRQSWGNQADYRPRLTNCN